MSDGEKSYADAKLDRAREKYARKTSPGIWSERNRSDLIRQEETKEN